MDKVIKKNFKGFLIGGVASAIANYLTVKDILIFNSILGGLLGILLYRLLHLKQ